MENMALVLFAVVISLGVMLYAIYMFIALLKKIDIRTPDDKTFRLAFCVVIIVTIAFLGLGCKGEIDKNITTVLGTIAGYVLGGVKRAA